jgi:hypothetical protein
MKFFDFLTFLNEINGDFLSFLDFLEIFMGFCASNGYSIGFVVVSGILRKIA